jgi:tetratricopeptide (TPR) repeat protein
MTFDKAQMIRVTKRLREAAGYLELDMTDHALERLDAIGELGPLEGNVALVRGEALRRQHRFDAAVTSLKTAVLKSPPPQQKPALWVLSLCYRQAGDQARADQMLAFARGVRPQPQG